MYEWRRCHFAANLENTFLRGCFQCVLVSTKNAMYTSKCPISLHILSKVWLPVASLRLFTFWKIMRFCCSSLGVVIWSPKGRLPYFLSLSTKDTHHLGWKSKWLLSESMLMWDSICGVDGGLMEELIGSVVIVWFLDGCGCGDILSDFNKLTNQVWWERL